MGGIIICGTGDDHDEVLDADYVFDGFGTTPEVEDVGAPTPCASPIVEPPVDTEPAPEGPTTSIAFLPVKERRLDTVAGEEAVDARG